MTTKTGRRIPTTPFRFNSFLIPFIAMLVAGDPNRATVLGILPEELAFMQDFATRWSPLYALYENAKGTRTAVISEEIHLQVKEFLDYDKSHNILTRIGASPYVIVSELEICNIHSTVLRKEAVPTLKNPISCSVYPVIVPNGHSNLKIRCGNSLNDKISIVEGATDVEYCYKIGGEMPIAPNLNEMVSGTSPKARFELRVSNEVSAQKIYMYFRWVNRSYPDFCSTWSNMVSTVLL